MELVEELGGIPARDVEQLDRALAGEVVGPWEVEPPA
jgi:hypothetical protein